MVIGGSTTSTDNPRASRDGVSSELGEVFGRRSVEQPRTDDGRPSGVWNRRECWCVLDIPRRLMHALNHTEEPLWTHRAVGPDCRDLPFRERGDNLLWVVTGERASVLGEGHKRDHGEVRTRVSRVKRSRHFVKASHCFEHEQVNPCFEERLDLLSERVASYLCRQGANRGNGCLLYTSDAADDLTRVDLGGRRII